MAIKAQLFSMIALLMSLFFILLFSGITRVPLDSDVEANQAQALYLNDVVLDLDSLIISSAESSSLQILNFSVSHLNGSNYFSNFSAFFDDCFITGSFYDEYDAVEKLCSPSNDNVSFVKLIQEVFDLTAQIHNLNITIQNIEHNMSLFDAYSLEILAKVDVDVRLISQRRNIAWQREIIVSSQVDFNGIRDPASIGTNFPRRIVHRPDERTFARIGFRGSALLVGEYINNTYYFLDQTGPSFFDRMEGRQTANFNLTDANPLGIATFIPPYNQSGDSLYLPNVSMVDHHYDWGANPQIDLLRFFESSYNINPNVTLYREYVLQGLGFNESNLVELESNCDQGGLPGCVHP